MWIFTVRPSLVFSKYSILYTDSVFEQHVYPQQRVRHSIILYKAVIIQRTCKTIRPHYISLCTVYLVKQRLNYFVAPKWSKTTPLLTLFISQTMYVFKTLGRLPVGLCNLSIMTGKAWEINISVCEWLWQEHPCPFSFVNKKGKLDIDESVYISPFKRWCSYIQPIQFRIIAPVVEHVLLPSGLEKACSKFSWRCILVLRNHPKLPGATCWCWPHFNTPAWPKTTSKVQKKNVYIVWNWLVLM